MTDDGVRAISEFECRYRYDPMCPHCGHIIRDAWEINFGPGLDGETELLCGHCESEFICERSTEVRYSTRKKEDR